MNLTDEQLKRIMPHTTARVRSEALPILNAVAKQYSINTERRMAMWLATLAAESGELKYQEEIASGSAYEGRTDLGNTQKGDGRRFKGHGRIQITGRTNHTKYTNYLKRAKHLPFIDFVENPKALAQEPYATDAAGWFWAVYKNLNPVADRGDFLTTQVKVNGRNKKTGLPNHYDVRQRYYARGLSVLPDNFTLDSGVSTPTAVQTATDNTSPSDEPQNSEPPTTTEVTQNADTIINEESLVDKASGLGDKFQSFQGVLDKFGFSIDDAKRSLGTVLLTWFKAIGSAAMVVGGVLLNHWELLIIAVLLAVLAYLLWDRSGQRVAEAKAGVPVDVAKEMLK